MASGSPSPSFPPFPTDIFRIIVEHYAHDCRRRGDLRSLSYITRVCCLTRIWLEPVLFSFVRIKSLQRLDLFTQFSSSQPQQPDQSQPTSPSSPLLQTKAVSFFIPSIPSDLTPDTIVPNFHAKIWKAVRSLPNIQRACFEPHHTFWIWKNDPVTIPDLTIYLTRSPSNLLYSQSLKMLWKPPEVHFNRLRFSMPMNDIRTQTYPQGGSLYSGFEWTHNLRKATHFAFDILFMGSRTFWRAFEILNQPGWRMDNPERLIMVLYMMDESVAERFKTKGVADELPPTPKGLKYLCLSPSEHEEWRFENLEFRGLNFWDMAESRLLDAKDIHHGPVWEL